MYIYTHMYIYKHSLLSLFSVAYMYVCAYGWLIGIRQPKRGLISEDDWISLFSLAINCLLLFI